MPANIEGGLRPSRIEFVEEDTEGVTPTNPDFQLVSDRITEFEPEFGPDSVEKDGLGQHDHAYAAGLEENELTLTYDLQRWFYNADGTLSDLSAYGLFRSAVGHQPGSVTLVETAKTYKDGDGFPNKAESTVHFDYLNDGNAQPRHTHLYTVARGATVDEATLTGDPEEVYWSCESTLMCQTGRPYQIDQPDSNTYLAVQAVEHGDMAASNDADTELRVEIESNDATTTETVTLDADDASAIVGTTSQFESIESIEVRVNSNDEVADHMGDILVYEAEGTDSDGDGNVDTYSEGQLLAVLYGYSFYNNTHGDYGVPALGQSGSHGSEIGGTITGTDYFAVGNALVERPYGRAFEAAGAVTNIEVSIENDSEQQPTNQSREQRAIPGMRAGEITMEADGETLSHRGMKQTAAQENIDTAVLFDREGSLRLEAPEAPMSESTRSRSGGENALDMEYVVMSGEAGLDATLPSP